MKQLIKNTINLILDTVMTLCALVILIISNKIKDKVA